ncbi:hypothetical protein JCM8547_003225 [Rhodosporidiobolus lusitaniae]
MRPDSKHCRPLPGVDDAFAWLQLNDRPLPVMGRTKTASSAKGDDSVPEGSEVELVYGEFRTTPVKQSYVVGYSVDETDSLTSKADRYFRADEDDPSRIGIAAPGGAVYHLPLPQAKSSTLVTFRYHRVNGVDGDKYNLIDDRDSPLSSASFRVCKSTSPRKATKPKSAFAKPLPAFAGPRPAFAEPLSDLVWGRLTESEHARNKRASYSSPEAAQEDEDQEELEDEKAMLDLEEQELGMRKRRVELEERERRARKKRMMEVEG